MREAGRRAGQVTTSDDVRLHYVETGFGKPVVMIPCWSQTAE
jgi:non-heme chloroperoxidase